jgi:hypothetical protein
MPTIPLSSETQRRLDAIFVEPDRHTVSELLITQCGAGLPLWHEKDPQGLERIRFAALKLSNGSLAELIRAVQIAQVDWRDVIIAAGFDHDVRAHQSWFPDEHAA